MMYPKTQTLWKRSHLNGIILPGQYSRDEFENIKWWHITEKIDGMNVRVIYETKTLRDYPHKPLPDRVTFAGRSDKAIMPKELLDNLIKTFTVERMQTQFPDSDYVVLFGEGYGRGINNGGLYRDDQNFILFDIFVGGWWLEQDKVTEIAKELNILRAPVLGIWTKEQAISFIEHDEKNSLISTHPREMEGIMCRSHPLMLFRNKKPLMFKLKVKDYRSLKKENYRKLLKV